jgi:hypothetical protein
MTARAIMPSASLATPETYLDADRAQGFVPQLRPGTHDYPGVPNPQLNEFALRGRWNVGSQSATPVGAPGQIEARVQAAAVYLVLTSAGDVPRSVHVRLDGKPIQRRSAGRDVHGGTVTVRGQRLYALVALPTAQRHILTVTVPPGVSAYDFTFG